MAAAYGLRLDCASPASTNRAPQSWDVFTSCNKWTSIRHINQQMSSCDGLLRCHFRPRGHHFGAHSRSCFRLGPANRLACYQKKFKAEQPLTTQKLGLNNGHTRPSRSRHQLRHRLLRFEHLQDESSSSALDQWFF